MKNKGLTITLIVLLSIIVILLIAFLVINLSSGNNSKIKMFNIGSKSDNIIVDKTFELEEIKNIEIKQEAGDIFFKESENDDIKVIIYGDDEREVDVTLKNSKLTIDYTKQLSNVLFCFGMKQNDIIVYLPSKYENSIKIENDYGNCEMIDLEKASTNIECDAGDVNLGKIRNAIIKCDYGNIEIEEVLNKCDIKADCGNVDIDTISIKENSNIKVDLGNIEIGNTSDIYIEANVDLGEINVNRNDRNSEITLKIDCDCGDITVDN